MTSQQPHPLRCETCKHHGEYTPYKMECPLYGYEYNACQMDCITRLIGCASHSDASNPEHCADSCIYKRFAKNMENMERHDKEVREKAISDMCDALEPIAITESWIAMNAFIKSIRGKP